MRFWPWVCAVAVACGEPAPAISPKPTNLAPVPAEMKDSGVPTQPEKRGPIVVAIVVDQLSAWVAASRWPQMPTEGGFARLMREGTWVKNLRHAHAVTDTGPGHAALHTGKTPHEHGIYANELPAGDHRVSILRDESTRAIAADGTKDAPGSSASLLRAETVADRLRAAHPEALVVSISLKDRGAILPAGKHPTWALWYDSGLDQWVTSTAFGNAFPSWAQPIADKHAIEIARSVAWQPLDAPWLAAHSATKDDAPGEGDLEGLGITFPHVAKTPNAFRSLPATDRIIAELGHAAIAAEHDASKPTLLLLSFSACDVVGHVFGPDSWEAWDQLRKLDRVLGDLLKALDQRASKVSVVLAADHGNISMPEAPPPKPCGADDPWERPCVPGYRIGPKAAGDALQAAAVKALGPGAWVAGVADPYVHLTPAARALPAGKRATLDKAIRGWFATQKAVDEVIDTKVLAEKCPKVLESARTAPERAAKGEPLMSLLCRAWGPGTGAGDYYVTVKPGSFWDGELVVGKGTSHGSPYLYDRTVPLLVRAPGDAEAGIVIEDPVDFSAYAAIEAHLVGLDQRPIPEILRALTAHR